jgi:hypothetical protein
MPAAARRRLEDWGPLAWLACHPRQGFAAFAALHFLVWSALPTLIYSNLPLDLLEALVYGREWQLGHDKLPPLPWWLVEIAYRLFGTDFAYYALAQATVLAALAVVWRLADRLVGPAGALAAVLIVDGAHYFHFTAAKFNHDVVQLPIWALAGYALHQALRRGRPIHWLLLGVAFGLGVWAKYFIVVLALPFALFLLLDPQARPALRAAGPWIAVAVALAIAAPHLWWLVSNDFLPFVYAEARARPASGTFGRVTAPLSFAAGQLAALLPALLIAAPLLWPRGRAAQPPEAPAVDAFDRRIVTMLAFGPFATVLALSAATDREVIAMWGYPLWLFLGLWIILTAKSLDRVRLVRIALLWALVFTLTAVGFAAGYTVLPHLDGRYRAALFPGRELGRLVQEGFRAQTGRPLAYVIGQQWEGSNVAHYAPDRPRLLLDGKPARSPWIDLADLKAKGAAAVWPAGVNPTPDDALLRVTPNVAMQPPLTLPMHRTGTPLTFRWAIVPPTPAVPN